MRRLVVLLSIGCAGEAGRATLELGAFTVQPGEEGLRCATFANPFGRDVEITAIRARLVRGGHHLLLFAREGAVDADDVDCGDVPPFESLLFAAEQPGEEDVLAFPHGTTARIGRDTGFFAHVHHLNAGDAPLVVENEIELEVGARGGASVAPLVFVNTDVFVPAGAPPTEVARTCRFEHDVDLVWLTSHMHSHGLKIEVAAGDELLLRSTDWGEPGRVVFAPPRTVPAGQELRFACTYRSAPDAPLAFGPSLVTDEMCVIAGAWAARPGVDGALLPCVTPEGGLP